MARQARVAPAGQIYHVMNRAVGRFVMMRKDEDFMAFERVMIQAHERWRPAKADGRQRGT